MSLLASTNNVWFIAVVILLLSTIALLIYFLFRQKKLHEEQLDAEVERSKSMLDSEIKHLSRIFEGAGIGLAVYRADGSLQFSDRKMSNLLDDFRLPRTLEKFLDRYGEENGLKTSYFLGNNSSEAFLDLNDKNLRLRFNKFSLDEKEEYLANSFGDEGIVFFAQDISKEIEEDEQRKKFVANVSHELKTPITVMKIYAETLLDWGLEEKSSAAINKDVQNILDNANRMESLVQDLLLLSKIDSKGSNLNVEECDIHILLQQVIEQCRIPAEEKNINLELHSVSKLSPVLADKNSLSRVFSNLILNAIKYNNDNGKVEIYISRVINDIVIKVKDNGLGIDPRYQKNIFNRFYRVDQTGSRQYGGTGLGLSIAKELVELHHGKITVNSALTSGSEFVVNLPSVAKFYTQTMQSTIDNPNIERYKEDADSLSVYAYNKLLTEANELGFNVDYLEDLTMEQRDIILQPYLVETRSKGKAKDKSKKVKEDFAGILDGSKKVSEDKNDSASLFIDIDKDELEVVDEDSNAPDGDESEIDEFDAKLDELETAEIKFDGSD